MNEQKRMQLVGAVERTVGDDKKTWWTRIGIGFQNRDGSWTLQFDYIPTRLAETTIQLREFPPKRTQNSEAQPE
jgi:hypothetical protein